MKQATLLHIPRTGGASRRDALAKAENWHCPPHDYRLSKVPRERLPAVFLRDPVDRFVSAYDYLLERGNPALRKRPESPYHAEVDFMQTWPTCEAMAIDIDAAWPVIQRESMIFRPMTWWLDDERPDLFIGCFDGLRLDFAALLRRTGTPPRDLPHVNAVPRRSTLSPLAQWRIRQRYDEDDYLWRSNL